MHRRETTRPGTTKTSRRITCRHCFGQRRIAWVRSTSTRRTSNRNAKWSRRSFGPVFWPSRMASLPTTSTRTHSPCIRTNGRRSAVSKTSTRPRSLTCKSFTPRTTVPTTRRSSWLAISSRSSSRSGPTSTSAQFRNPTRPFPASMRRSRRGRRGRRSPKQRRTCRCRPLR